MVEPYVLVVDDEKPLRELLVRWLDGLGYRAVAVGSAEEALKTIDSALPTAVIADVVMPVHDGLWLLEAIRARWPTLPVVMSSGATLDNDTVRKARVLKAVDFITKPFAREALYQALLRATEGKKVLETAPD